MGAPKRKQAIVAVTYWAVGRTKNSSLVALQLNDDAPVVLQAKEAKDIAVALQNEAEAIVRLELERDKSNDN
jgi:hypothetical protein